MESDTAHSAITPTPHGMVDHTQVGNLNLTLASSIECRHYLQSQVRVTEALLLRSIDRGVLIYTLRSASTELVGTNKDRVHNRYTTEMESTAKLRQ